MKGNVGQCLLLRSDSDLRLNGWCDSDWASCPITRKSVTGYFVQLGDSPISWKTIKQKTVSLSSAEAEYRAMRFLVQELTWLKRVLLTLGGSHNHPMLVHCDSKSTIHIATNPVFHERTNHVEADCHYVHDEVTNGAISLSHVPSKAQLADIFTKPLGANEFSLFRSKLGIQNLHAPP